jgi:putative phage-type endonuclease
MEQGTQEWLDLRRTKIGASDAAAILGICPYRTAFQLWEEKVLGKEQEKTSGMARGSSLEAEARECFEKATQLSVMPKVVIHGGRPWQMASLDGITFDGTTIVEIKCPNKEVHKMAEAGKIPDHYMAQIQHQFSVSDAVKGYYFSYNGQQGVIVEIFPDMMFISDMLSKEKKFYELMINKEAPALTDRDYLKKDDPEWNSLAKEYIEVKDEIHILLQCKESIEEKLKALAGNKNAQGGGIRLTKSFCKGRVDYDAVPELIGVDLDPYRKPPCEKWRLSAINKDEG